MDGERHDQQVRIIVTNADSVNQADLWLTHGPQRAMAIFCTVLRTALVLGGELVVDRNQLLDGVCFLALGPDGVAEALGLSAHEPLPIVVNCEPSDDLVRAVPRRGGRELLHTPDLKHVCLQRQLDSVRSATFVSSALAALGVEPETRSWMFPTPADGHYSGVGFRVAAAPMLEPTADQAVELVHQAQNEWLRALELGRVEADLWGGAMDLPTALRDEGQALREMCVGDERPAELALHVLAQESSRRGPTVEAIDAWRQEHPGTPDEHLRLALSLWSRAYYAAIATSGGALLLNLTVEDPTEDTSPAVLHSFGEAAPPERTWRARWRRWRRRARSGDGGTTRVDVDGDLLELMRIIHPASYRHLSLQLQRRGTSVLGDERQEAIGDLVLGARQLVPELSSYRETTRAIRRRVLVGTLLAMAITWLSLVSDLSAMSARMKILTVVAGSLLGLLASLPWGDIISSLQLRPSAMSATLSVKERRP